MGSFYSSIGVYCSRVRTHVCVFFGCVVFLFILVSPGEIQEKCLCCEVFLHDQRELRFDYFSDHIYIYEDIE